MPELPEVETVRRTLNQLVVGKTIERVTVNLPRIIQRPDDIDAFALELAGHTIIGVERRGKFYGFCWTGWYWSPICGWKVDTAYTSSTKK